MQRTVLVLFILLLNSPLLQAQLKQPLTYYLPDITYDKDIPTPEAYLGYQIGEWHLSYDQQLAYLRELAARSPRIVLQEIGHTYEGRPTVNLIITSEKNHERLDEIKARHLALSDPALSAEVNTADLPTVLYQGYSIHGNEASGGNAAPLVAYYLAAGKGREFERMLDNLIVIFEPCYNPDGFTRFATWVNMHKNVNLTANGDDREYDEVWPGGRTNHYWFDLNRDWMPVQHPESQGRVAAFHEWKPNVLTDHHEMGTNSTFFFMPGEPTRVHPITPGRNQDLTAAIAKYHAATLDDIQALYYSGEGYDDFYYGKGSTYPDANGCIGILFEQASSRGHIQESANGLLTFPFTIRNQVRTALSTYQACYELREDLNNFQRDFYTTALEEARTDERKAFVFGEPFDKARLGHFIEILRRHQIEVYSLAEEVSAGGQVFAPEHSYLVPLEQEQYRFIKAVFETMTTFEDSLFYDISAWTLPLAFNIPYAAVGKSFRPELLGPPVAGLRPEVSFYEPDISAYAYAFAWDEYYAPLAANYLLSQGLRLTLANQPFVAGGRQFNRGTVLLPLQNQELDEELIYEKVREASRMAQLSIYDIDSGWTTSGPDIGSRTVSYLRKPEVLLVVGEGVSAYDAGEVWHLLDQRYDIVTTMVATESLGSADLSRFNTIIMVNGSYRGLSANAATKINRWVAQGGTLIAYREAIRWCVTNGLGQATLQEQEREPASPDYQSQVTNAAQSSRLIRRPYQQAQRDAGGAVLGGAIFQSEVDLTHPLLYGYRRPNLPVFRRGTLFFEPTKNPYATPIVYTDAPLLSGYVNEENLQQIRNTASLMVSGLGSGRIIFMADNTNFRAFWLGTNKLLANAIFFGPAISSATIER